MAEKITFVRRGSHSGVIFGLALLAPPSLFMAAMLWFGIDPLDSLIGVIRRWNENPFEAVKLVLMTVAVSVVIPVSVLYERRARLVLDGATLTVVSGFRGVIGRLFERGWPLNLAEVDEAVVYPNPQHRISLALFPVDGRMRHIDLGSWIRQGSREPALRSMRLRPYGEAELQHLLHTLPLLVELRSRGVQVQMERTVPKRTRTGTLGMADLNEHPQAMFAVFLLLVCGGYGLVDGFFVQEYAYAERLPWSLWIGGGVAAALLIAPLLLRSRLPRTEAIVLTVMVGCGVGLAAYPGILRINVLTDAEGPREHIYVLYPKGVLRAEMPDLPVLTAPVYAPYWQGLPIGSHHEIVLYRGMFGFWQYHRAPIQDRVREALAVLG